MPPDYVAAHQEYGAPFWIEGKSCTPHSVRGFKPQFLHVCVMRALEGIDPGAAQSGAEFLEHPGMGQQLVLNVFGQDVKLRVEILMNQNHPLHDNIMPFATYVVKYILIMQKYAWNPFDIYVMRKAIGNHGESREE